MATPIVPTGTAANVIALVFQGVSLLATLVPTGIEAALKIKALFESSSSDITVQIQTIQDGAVQSAEETDQLIEAWMESHGYGSAAPAPAPASATKPTEIS